MGIFYITLITTYILGYLAREAGTQKEDELKTPNTIFFIMVTAIFIAVCGLRSNIGDTYFYKHSYDLMIMTGEVFGYEKGFAKLMLFLGTISPDPQILIFVTGFITNLFILLSLRREATYFEMSVYLFITSGYYLVTMNGMRQTMVAALYFFFGVKFIREKKLIFYVLLIFILSYFHKSVIFMLPSYFLAREEAFSKKMVLIILGTILIVLMFSSFAGTIKDIAGDYGYYIDSFNEGGANILRVLVNAVPVGMAYLYREELKSRWADSHIFINFSILNLIFYILSLQNWIFARVGLYAAIANFLLIPYIISRCMDEGKKTFFYLVCMICYFIFFYYEQVISMFIVYRSVILGIY